jgi:monothiol glutaredoxin
MNIILYTKRGCPWCNDVIDYLQREHIPFEEREVLSNEVFFQEMVTKSGQTKAPTVDIDGVILKDSDVDQVRSYLAGVLKR